MTSEVHALLGSLQTIVRALQGSGYLDRDQMLCSQGRFDKADVGLVKHGSIKTPRSLCNDPYEESSNLLAEFNCCKATWPQAFAGMLRSCSIVHPCIVKGRCMKHMQLHMIWVKMSPLQLSHLAHTLMEASPGAGPKVRTLILPGVSMAQVNAILMCMKQQTTSGPSIQPSSQKLGARTLKFSRGTASLASHLPGKAGEGTCVLVHSCLQGAVRFWKLQPAAQAVWVGVKAAVFSLHRDIFIACV